MGHYENLESRTPKQCFSTCKESDKCAAATYRIDKKSNYNCFLLAVAQFTESSDEEKEAGFYISFYTREVEEATTTTSTRTTSTTTSTTSTTTTTTTRFSARNQSVLKNTRLLNHYTEYESATADECFDLCDVDKVCAAACFVFPGKCRLFKFGFKRVSQRDGEEESTAYVKPEVDEEMSSIDKLSFKFPLVKQNTKLLGHYTSFDTLTPSECFKACKLSRRCGGATFTTDATFSNNCHLSRDDKSAADAIEAEMWTSYTKVG
jgi:hypothetical protein